MKTINIIKTLIVALVLAAGVSYISAWTGPLSSPPNCTTGNPGCDAPLNVGLNSQSKLGQLFVNTSVSNPYAVGLAVWGSSIFNGSVQINSGSPAANKVLVASDASGTVSWVATSTLGFGSGSAGRTIQTGLAPLNCGLSASSTTVNFPSNFSGATSTITITVLPRWIENNGNGATVFWVTNITLSSFKLNVNSPGSCRTPAENGVMWMAVQ